MIIGIVKVGKVMWGGWEIMCICEGMDRFCYVEIGYLDEFKSNFFYSYFGVRVLNF